MTEPAIRASDADRDHVAEQLRYHYTAGRLDTNEYEDRVTAAYTARSWSDLRAQLVDLPTDETAADEPTTASVDTCLLICLLIACPPAGVAYWLIANHTARQRRPALRVSAISVVERHNGGSLIDRRQIEQRWPFPASLENAHEPALGDGWRGTRGSLIV